VTRGGGFAGTIVNLSRTLGTALVSENVARQPGLLQSLDPRVRVIGVVSLVLAVTLSHKLAAIFAVFVASVMLAFLSRVSSGLLTTRVWLPVLLFTGVIALPALFVTPGATILSFPSSGLRITAQGLYSASLLILRVETAATLTALLVLATPWMHILKALRWFRLPQEVVMMLAMTHRYVFLLVETAGQMFESRQSRTVGVLDRATQRQVTARTAGVLLSKSIELSSEVFLAMQSRGFRGDARVLVEFRLRARDYLGLAAFLSLAILSVWVGRA
jgi:cobalt/nickel transport system permease protein